MHVQMMHSLAHLKDLTTTLAGVFAYIFYTRVSSDYMYLATYGQANNSQCWLVDDS